MPAISVVIPTFRRPQALSRAIACALSQTMRDLEVIVVTERDDDLSRPVLERVVDNRVRLVVNQEKGGPGKARDTGVEASAGNWVAFLDDDDEWLPEKLEKQLLAATGDSKVIVSALSFVVTPFGTLIRPIRPYDGAQPIDEWLFDRRTWFKGGERMLQTSSLLIPRALFSSIKFGVAHHEEWEFVIRATKQYGYQLITVNEPLIYYYTGNLYAWQKSLAWVRSVRDLITPRAYSGFCLTVATQALHQPDRNRAFTIFLREALLNGSPTPRQLFAFFLMWLLPLDIRQRIRAASRIMGSLRTLVGHHHK